MITIQGTVPIQTVRHDFDEEDTRSAVAKYIALYPQARLESINDEYIRGLTFCDLPVFEKDSGYQYDFDEKRFICPDEGCTQCQKHVLLAITESGEAQ